MYRKWLSTGVPLMSWHVRFIVAPEYRKMLGTAVLLFELAVVRNGGTVRPSLLTVDC
jgi:hypothetical protein